MLLSVEDSPGDDSWVSLLVEEVSGLGGDKVEDRLGGLDSHARNVSDAVTWEDL